jgi:hypothetical protein
MRVDVVILGVIEEGQEVMKGRRMSGEVVAFGVVGHSTGRLPSAGFPNNLMEIPRIKLAERREFRPRADN